MSIDSSRRRQQGTSLHALPEPDSESLAQSGRLVGLVTDEIGQSGGQIPFDRFMELALYAPGLGYYSAGSRKFGEQGDFVTAPESSDLFARCIAHQCQQVLEETGGGDLLEFGAGSGVLAADLLAALEKLDALPGRYLIVEVSPDLRARQKALLQRRVSRLLDRVNWLDGFPEPGFRGLVIANELLDAMPVNRFRVEHGQILEQYVVQEGGRFATVVQWQDMRMLQARSDPDLL